MFAVLVVAVSACGGEAGEGSRAHPGPAGERASSPPRVGTPEQRERAWREVLARQGYSRVDPSVARIEAAATRAGAKTEVTARIVRSSRGPAIIGTANAIYGLEVYSFDGRTWRRENTGLFVAAGVLPLERRETSRSVDQTVRRAPVYRVAARLFGSERRLGIASVEIPGDA